MSNSDTSILPGDVIQTPGIAGTQHLGVYVGRDFIGRRWVIHNAKHDRVKLDIIEDFSSGLQVTLATRAVGGISERKAILERARRLLGRPYDLVAFNCEHFVTYATTGEAFSPQLRCCMAGILLATIVIAASEG